MQHIDNKMKIKLFNAYSVHLLTACTAIVALYTLYFIVKGNYIMGFLLMGAAIFIDGIDGTLARRAHVKTITPNIDGALLDNIVDYMNYVLTPCFFLLMCPGVLSAPMVDFVVVTVLIASAYQFVQMNAKTEDNFFLGFPCYWNFTVFYLYLFKFSPSINAAILIGLSIMIFVPIKYIYPSRMTHMTHSRLIRQGILAGAGLFGIANLYLLYVYPQSNLLAVFIIIGYIAIYMIGSLYRTLFPLK